MSEPKAVSIEGREIAPVPGEANLYYYLDLPAQRHEFVVVRIDGSAATAKREGAVSSYTLTRRNGRWACTCKAVTKGHGRCYHVRVVEGVELLARREREARTWARIAAAREERAAQVGARGEVTPAALAAYL